jgi:hypothetical protein
MNIWQREHVLAISMALAVLVDGDPRPADPGGDAARRPGQPVGSRGFHQRLVMHEEPKGIRRV